MTLLPRPRWKGAPPDPSQATPEQLSALYLEAKQHSKEPAFTNASQKGTQTPTCKLARDINALHSFFPVLLELQKGEAGDVVVREAWNALCSASRRGFSEVFRMLDVHPDLQVRPAALRHSYFRFAFFSRATLRRNTESRATRISWRPSWRS